MPRKLKLPSTSQKKQEVRIHPSVEAREATHTFSLQNVKEWINYNKKQAASYNTLARNRTTSSEEKFVHLRKANDHLAYVKECEHYIKHGDWIADNFGMKEEYKTIRQTIAGPPSKKILRKK
jgi:hypothetical protein|tara:strand:- start:1726 stop:2091 length:366 start_codon:yes stop_codon:yes gene_type:complete